MHEAEILSSLSYFVYKRERECGVGNSKKQHTFLTFSYLGKQTQYHRDTEEHPDEGIMNVQDVS